MFLVLTCLLCVCCVYVSGAWAFGKMSSIFRPQYGNGGIDSFAWTWPMTMFGTASAPPQDQLTDDMDLDGRYAK